MIKRIAFASIVAALALAAVPVFAAANPTVDLPEDPHFTVHGGKMQLTTTGGNTVSCETLTGTGEFKNGSGGPVQFTYHGCKASGTSCTTPGQPAGTITPTEFNFQLGTIPGGKRLARGGSRPAIVVKPESATDSEEVHYATFNCAFGLVHVEVTGTGFVAPITEPGYNEPSSTITFNFASTEPGHQEYTTFQGSEAELDMHSTFGGGEAETTSFDTTISFHFTNEGEATLTAGA